MLLGVAKFWVLNASIIHIKAKRATKVRLNSVPIRARFLVSVNRTASAAASAAVLLSTLMVGYPPKGFYQNGFFSGLRRRWLRLELFHAPLFLRRGLRPTCLAAKHARNHKYRRPPADRRRSR